MSNLPANTEAFLYKTGTWQLPGTDDRSCEGARFHSPTPLFVRDVPLVKPEWWPEDQRRTWSWPTAYLCGICRDNLDILLQMLKATEGNLDWPIRREFGNELRSLALKGWKWFETHRPAADGQSPTKG